MIVTEKKLDELDKKILRYKGEGMTAKEISYELNISQRSVEAKIREMMAWYKCKNLPQLLLHLRDQL